MKYKFYLFLIFFGSLSFSGYCQTNLFVSPDGSGELFSQGSPGRLDQVMARIHTLSEKSSAELVVLLKGGTYSLKKPLLIDNLDSSLPAAGISFKSVSGERAVISGGQKITGWSPAGKGIFKARVTIVAFRQLYVNGKMAVRARTPNRENADDFGPYNRIGSFDGKTHTINIPASRMPETENTGDMEMVINQHWYQSRLRVGSCKIDKDSARISVKEPEKTTLFGMTGNKMLWPAKPYYFENALAFLDAENEWYLDKSTRMLYYKPPAGKTITGLEIVAPIIETLIQVSGTAEKPIRNIRFQNIDFAFGNWLLPNSAGSILTQGAQLRGTNQAVLPGLIQVEFARNFQLGHCSVSGAGANGVVFSKGVWNSQVTNCHLHEISANGLVIDTWKKINPELAMQCRDNLIAQNLIENIGMQYTNGMGLIASCVSGLTVEHNEIRFGRYSGMQIGNHYGDKSSGTQDNLIRYNNIHQVMLLHDDGGAIYTLSNQKGTQIYENWIHDYTKCKWADSYPVNGVFLDNNSAYILVRDNVFTNLPGVEHLKENKTTQIHDNVFVNNEGQDGRIKAQSGITRGIPRKK